MNMHKWRERVVMSIQYYHDYINIEQLLVMDVQTGSTLAPQQELLHTFSFVMGGGACARILECRFLAPYFPFIVFKMFE